MPSFMNLFASRALLPRLALLVLIGLMPFSAFAQNLTGQLQDEAGQALLGGTVLATPTGTGATVDESGTWTLNVEGADSLKFSYVGYQSQTLAVEAVRTAAIIVMRPRSLDVVTVTSRQRGNYTSTLDPRNVESITSVELKKAPCCNLGESFETNAAVDVSYRDAVTGSREMQVLGLRGVYSQLLLEKRPTLYGLASSQALDYIPGTWLTGIQIGKGASSVQTGASALSGQINTELVKPFETEPVFVNLFASGLGRFEANVHLANEWNERSSTGLLLHSSYNTKAHDRDDDGFYEQPGRETYSAMLRHFYRTNDWRAQANVWVTRDRREGGQSDHAGHGEHGPAHGDGKYVLAQANDRVEAFAKTGYLGFSRPNTSAGLIAGATFHQLDNLYGSVMHEGTQRSGYINAMYSSFLGTTAHTYTVGASAQVDSYDEVYDHTIYDRDESAVGAFAEYTYDFRRGTSSGNGLYGASIIAGLRVDHHSLGGVQALPRLNVKINPTENLALRASAGRAYRSPQVLAENIRLLASSKSFRIPEPLQLTTGWNYGVALSQNLSYTHGGHQRVAAFTLDAYATVFDRLAVIDQEQTFGHTTAANSTAPAQTIAVLASVRVEPVDRLEVKLAYKHVNSKQTYLDGVKREVPYVARWRGLVSSDYETASKRWRFNANLQLVGPQRLPSQDIAALIDIPYRLTYESPVFALLGAQATYVVNDFLEVYGGAENITDYRQTNAIIGAQNDALYFDASRVYAPLVGVMPYVGLRYTLVK